MMSISKSHPSVLITRLTEYFECKGDKPIKVGLSNSSLKIAEKIIKRNKQRFDASAEVEIKNFGSKDQTTSAAIKEGQAEIILSFCSDEYRRKYHESLVDLEGFDDILSFIKSKVEIPTKEQQADAEFKKLFACTRMEDENETFSSYINRLTKIAKNVDGDQNTQLFLVKSVFKKNLAKFNQFLIDHRMSSRDINDIAIFLDERNKHKRNLLVNEINQTNVLLTEMENRLSDKLDEKVERIMALMCTTATPTVNKVAVNASGKKSNKSNETEFCSKCGMRNHKTEECNGGCRLTCFICKQQGHLKNVCPKKALN